MDITQVRGVVTLILIKSEKHKLIIGGVAPGRIFLTCGEGE